MNTFEDAKGKSELIKILEDSSYFDDFTIEEIISINGIFNILSKYPTFKTEEDFENFLLDQKFNIKLAKKAIEENSSSVHLFDKKIFLACHYLYPENEVFKIPDLSIEKQKMFIKLLAIISPTKRKKIEIKTKKAILKKEKEIVKNNISNVIES